MRLTGEGRKRKEAIMELASKRGISSLRQLCLKSGMESSNLYSNFNGSYDVSLKRIFKLANAMNEDVVNVIKALCPDAYAENQANILPVDDTQHL